MSILFNPDKWITRIKSKDDLEKLCKREGVEFSHFLTQILLSGVDWIIYHDKKEEYVWLINNLIRDVERLSKNQLHRARQLNTERSNKELWSTVARSSRTQPRWNMVLNRGKMIQVIDELVKIKEEGFVGLI